MVFFALLWVVCAAVDVDYEVDEGSDHQERHEHNEQCGKY